MNSIAFWKDYSNIQSATHGKKAIKTKQFWFEHVVWHSLQIRRKHFKMEHFVGGGGGVGKVCICLVFANKFKREWRVKRFLPCFFFFCCLLNQMVWRACDKHFHHFQFADTSSSASPQPHFVMHEWPRWFCINYFVWRNRFLNSRSLCIRWEEFGYPFRLGYLWSPLSVLCLQNLGGEHFII